MFKAIYLHVTQGVTIFISKFVKCYNLYFTDISFSLIVYSIKFYQYQNSQNERH